MKSLDKLKDVINYMINNHVINAYNIYTREYDKGYNRCLRDILNIIDKIERKNKDE